MKFPRVLSASVLAGAVLLSSTACGFFPQEEKQKPSSEITLTPKPNPGDAVNTTGATPTPSVSETLIENGSTDGNGEAPLTLDMDPDNSGMEENSTPEFTEELTEVDEGSWDTEAAEEDKFVAEEPVIDPGAGADAETAMQAGRVAASLNDYFSYVLNPATYDQLVAAGKPLQGGGEVSEKVYFEFAENNPGMFRHYDTSTAVNIRNAYIDLLVGSSFGKTAPGLSITIPVDAVVVYGDNAVVDLTQLVVKKDGVDYSRDMELSTTSMDLNKLSNGAWVMVAPTSQA